MDLADLRIANIERDIEWNGTGPALDPAFRGVELAGEVGEACNVIKKLERSRRGLKGSTDTLEHLGEELADIVICTDLVAMYYGLDLSAAIRRKFNLTSDKVGLQTKL